MLGSDVVYNYEKPYLKQLIDFYGEYNTWVLGVQTVVPENVNKYGIVGRIQIEDRVYKVKKLVKKPSLEESVSNVTILGRYIITPKIFEILENKAPRKGNEIELTDELLKLIEEEAIYVYDFKDRGYDAGDKQNFLEATVEYAIRREELSGDFIDYLKIL